MSWAREGAAGMLPVANIPPSHCRLPIADCRLKSEEGAFPVPCQSAIGIRQSAIPSAGLEGEVDFRLPIAGREIGNSSGCERPDHGFRNLDLRSDGGASALRCGALDDDLQLVRKPVHGDALERLVPLVGGLVDPEAHIGE